MTYEEFASDLPLKRTVVFRSSEENQETMRRLGVNQEVRQLGKGKFRSDLALLETEHAAFFADRFNKACSIYLEPPAGMVALLVFRSFNGNFLASGENVANDKLVFLPQGSGTDLVAPDLMGSDAITVPEARFNEMIHALWPTRKKLRLERMTVIEGNTAQLQGLRKGIIHLVEHRESPPDHEQLTHLLAETIAWIGDSSTHLRLENFTVNGARRRVAKLAQEFIEENFQGTVHMEDLCRATGFGLRTIQRCFREYFDLTILEYIKIIRLNAAHRKLFAAHPLENSVTNIAFQNGFSHLGRFSVEFRKHFGESPRDTLKMRASRNSFN